MVQRRLNSSMRRFSRIQFAFDINLYRHIEYDNIPRARYRA